MIVIDAILSKTPDVTIVVKSISQFDIFMMTHRDVKERSQQDFLALAKATSFSSILYDCFVQNL